MAGVDGHRTADGVADPQFRFLAESQLLADRPSSPHLVPRTIRFGSDGHPESLDAGRPA